MLPTQNALALEELGWNSFQDLGIAFCEDLLNAAANSFSPTKDRGVDGLIEPIAGKGSLATTVIQVKHTARPSPLTLAHAQKEVAKVAALAELLPVSRYILFTNHTITTGQWLRVKRSIEDTGVSNVLVVGRENIVRRVRKSARLRGMVPRLYGIGDLSQILDERRFEQAKAMLTAAHDDLKTFVVTESYRNSLHALRQHRVLILLGDPAVGKSTIARCLAMASVDEFDAHPIVLEGVEHISSHWNPNDNKRLFWIDDAFGTTQLDQQSVQAFNRLIPTVYTAMRYGNRFIFTSRTYLWLLARTLLKLSAFPNYDSARVEIDVRRFTEFERGQIVYNHVRMGDQTQAWRHNIKPFLPQVARHREFKPEVARRLGLRAFTGELKMDEQSIERFVTNPAAFLEETIRTLDRPSRAALASILMSGGSLPSPVVDEGATAAVCRWFDTTVAELGSRLDAMNGPFVRRVAEADNFFWRFTHPTIGEAMASVATSDSQLLDVFIAGAHVDRLLSEVSCAGRTVKGAIIYIDAPRFPSLIRRLREAKDSWAVLTFLAYRTSAGFRKAYFDTPLMGDDRLMSGKSLRNRAVMDLLTLLNRQGLVDVGLLEQFRGEAALGITRFADADCLSPSSQELLGADLFEAAVKKSWGILSEEPWGIVDYLEEDLDRDVDPEDTLYEAVAFAEELQEFVPESEFGEVRQRLADYVKQRSEAILEEREENPTWDDDWDRDESRSFVARKANPSVRVNLREGSERDRLASLFSDVDAES